MLLDGMQGQAQACIDLLPCVRRSFKGHSRRHGSSSCGSRPSQHPVNVQTKYIGAAGPSGRGACPLIAVMQYVQALSSITCRTQETGNLVSGSF